MTGVANGCTYCHTPIRIDRYEYATNGTYTYRICPECDYSMPIPATAVSAQPNADAESDRLIPVVTDTEG